ncbi:MAG: iron complex outermembrane receptor protein, partial [Oceanospirillaceae bacterium]
MKSNLFCKCLLLALLFPSVIFAQTVIKGKVIDASNKEALASATVQMTGSVLGVLTNENGNFELKTSKIPPFKLSFSFIGYTVQTVEVTSVDQVVNVALEYGMQFDEVVIS